jgi:hypothetical protein
LRLRKILGLISVGVVLATLLTNSFYLGFLFPFGQPKPYHEQYLQFAQIAQQANAVVVSVNARLIWVLSDFKIDFIDLAEFANERNIDNASASILVGSIRSDLQAGRTVMYMVTGFEIGHASEYGNFENDFSFFLSHVLQSFNSTQLPGNPVPPPEYILVLS